MTRSSEAIPGAGADSVVRHKLAEAARMVSALGGSRACRRSDVVTAGRYPMSAHLTCCARSHQPVILERFADGFV